MAQIKVQNITEGSVMIRDFYRALRPGETVETERSVEQLRGMTGLQQALAKEQVTVAVEYTEAERLSGLIPDLSA